MIITKKEVMKQNTLYRNKFMGYDFKVTQLMLYRTEEKT